LAVSVALHGLKTGLYVYVMTLLIPAFFALWTIMLFNYDQHVHTDPWSKHNHSRSWDGKLLNFLLFNNGLHSAHHENPGVHWSKLPEVHAAVAPLIDPVLIERSLFWYWAREYFVAPFIPSMGSKQIGRAPFDAPDGGPVNVTSADVDVGEAGTNAQMVGS
jgi:fatty acid desaturase